MEMANGKCAVEKKKSPGEPGDRVAPKSSRFRLTGKAHHLRLVTAGRCRRHGLSHRDMGMRLAGAASRASAVVSRTRTPLDPLGLDTLQTAADRLRFCY